MSYQKAIEAAVPTVHLNGTSREALEAQYRDAYRALERALQVISEAYPHERDYYVQGPASAYTAAKAKHASRISRLIDIRDEIEADYHAFLEANDERR